MSREQLKEALLASFPEAVHTEGKQFVMVTVDASKMPMVAEKLRNDSAFLFDYLFCVTGVDHPANFSVDYHLESTVTGRSMVLRAKTPNRENPELHTVSHIWPTAEFHEREIKEMYGIEFTGHPDPRNLLLPDDWNGFPMRKDYYDPVNIIGLE